ncbi:MAG TPA: protein kinase [Phycisphaerae bacterium]|nr:protein kinase [Phycisphaerae bacterium]
MSSDNDSTHGISELRQSAASVTITMQPNRTLAGERSRYIMKQFHARGGMGEIWLAEDDRIGREIAVKTLIATGAVARERFLTEARITGQLEHPAIIPLHDLSINDAGQPFYVMKFVRGKSLKSVIAHFHAPIRDGRLTCGIEWFKLLRVFTDICHVVAYAHSRGVLHRDIKPDNIMIGEYGETILLDWGLAKVRGQPEASGNISGLPISGSGSTTHTQAGSIMGSPLYMPPELAEGHASETDERTDVYLLGATLYEILTGHPPRAGRNREEILDLARTASPPPPRKIIPELPRAIDAICLKAMAHHREHRYASAMDLALDIQRYLADEPITACRESTLARLRRWSRKHRTAIRRTLSAIAVVALAGCGLFEFQRMERRASEAAFEAAQLQAREAARTQIQKFESQMDEARFFAASTDSAAEHAPYYDPQRFRTAASDALATAAQWGEVLDQLPSDAPRDRLRAELYELLLLAAQSASASPAIDPAFPDVPALLTRARQLNPALTRGYHELNSAYLAAHRDLLHAAQEHQLADDPATPSTAFDFFLQGEALRCAAAPDPLSAEPPPSLSARAQSLNAAITAYRHALQLDPRHYWSHFQLGRCYISLGHYPEAVESLGVCIALRPEAPWGYSARGIALGLLHRFDEAVADLDFALRQNPDFRPALLNRGVVRSLQHQPSAALNDFTAALQAPANHQLIEAAYYRAQLYIDAGQYANAATDLDALLAQRPAFTSAALLRARLAILQGQPADSLKPLNALLAAINLPLDSQSTAASLARRGHLFRLVATQLSGEAARPALQLAGADLQRALSLSPPTALECADLGAVLESLDHLQPAIAAYTQALQLAPDRAQLHIDRGWALQKSNQSAAAREDFAAAIALDPAGPEAHVALGYLEACARNSDRAQQEAAEALLTGSADYLVLHNVACIFGELSRPVSAAQTDYQNTALLSLRHAIDLYQSNTLGPDEFRLIQSEPAFPPALKHRREFVQLLETSQK